MSIRNADGTSVFSPNDSKSDDTPRQKIPLHDPRPFLDALFGDGFMGERKEQNAP